jgi:hypothetical protein
MLVVITFLVHALSADGEFALSRFRRVGLLRGTLGVGVDIGLTLKVSRELFMRLWSLHGSSFSELH